MSSIARSSASLSLARGVTPKVGKAQAAGKTGHAGAGRDRVKAGPAGAGRDCTKPKVGK